MEVDFRVQADTLVASLRGRLDTHTAPAFEEQAREALKRNEKKWVFDLSGLAYVSSAGLRVVLAAAKALKADGGEIRLAAAGGSVKKVFQISGFFSLFKYFDTPEAALEAF
ncbi:STAS domain-containing protein [Desulfatitalea tepidiphila]|jgi:anti-anti-sigma factor|uniref:STAS domain-containing protein n=1 Tax=Desulfatitalea tepidiphila TaxID=1185843 RepID=UPI0006B55CA9|nr:STAS domain-containing protein [Desulfatitalea tepidiphila]